MPEDLGPGWSKNFSIEYNNEFGGIPDQSAREAISEIVGFILGSHLLNIGYTKFDNSGAALEEKVFNPPENNIKELCGSFEYAPVNLLKDGLNIESILQELVPRYLSLRDDLKLKDVLWRYWLSTELPIGLGIPIMANGIEILADSWFKTKHSKTKGVYLSKKEFDEILKEELNKIKEKLNYINFGDKIFNRIENTFQIGASQKIEFFLNEEIGLKISKIEKEAIKARNKMAHSTYKNKNVAKHYIKLRFAYKTLFNRVILKILGYKGNYIDYTIVGCPEKPLEQPVGDK